MTTKYNGWTNWETWNVALWVSNEEPLYRLMREDMGKWTAETAEAFCRKHMPKGTPDFVDERGRGKGAKSYALVDWAEVAHDWNAE